MIEILALMALLGPSYIYQYPKTESDTAYILKKVDGKIKWKVKTDLIKNSSFLHSMGLIFQGCNFGSINSCEVLILNPKNGSILYDFAGSIAKVNSDYIIVSNSISKGAGYFDSYIIKDTVKSTNYVKYFTGIIEKRDLCDQFRITDSEFLDNSMKYTLNDSCGIWFYILPAV